MIVLFVIKPIVRKRYSRFSSFLGPSMASCRSWRWILISGFWKEVCGKNLAVVGRGQDFDCRLKKVATRIWHDMLRESFTHLYANKNNPQMYKCNDCWIISIESWFHFCTFFCVTLLNIKRDALLVAFLCVSSLRLTFWRLCERAANRDWI